MLPRVNNQLEIVELLNSNPDSKKTYPVRLCYDNALVVYFIVDKFSNTIFFIGLNSHLFVVPFVKYVRENKRNETTASV